MRSQLLFSHDSPPGLAPSVDFARSRDVTAPNYLLTNERAFTLYRQIADAPVIDYHTHISPRAMCENFKFHNIVELLLGSTKAGSPVFDHYFARLLKEQELSDVIVYGHQDVSDLVRWNEIAAVFSSLAPNPTYHWVRMALKNFFNIDDQINAAHASSIWDRTSALLEQDEFSIRGLLQKRNVAVVCTTDDPTDSLEFHQQYRRQPGVTTRLLPTWRPDKALIIRDDARNKFLDWVSRLEAVSGATITTSTDFLAALKSRHDFFHEQGCRVADIGLRNFVCEPFTQEQIDDIFARRQAGKALTDSDERAWQSMMLQRLARWNAEKGWVQQFHQGPRRDTNPALFDRIGPDAGGDVVGEPTDTLALQRFFAFLRSQRIEQGGHLLAKTIIYPLDATSYRPVLTLLGAFNEADESGRRLHLGVPWWFNDTEHDIRAWIGEVSRQSCLGSHIGMLSDSRSPVSSGTRFDYFRRILCDELVKLLPEFTDEALQQVALDICHRNAERYFRF